MNIVQTRFCNGGKSLNGVHGCTDIMGHPGKEFCLGHVRPVGFLRNGDPALLPPLGVTDHPGDIEHMGDFSGGIPVFHDKPGQMPVSVLGQILHSHRILFPQPSCQRGQIQKLPHIFPVTGRHEGVTDLLHPRRCPAVFSGETVQLILTGNLIIVIFFQINPENQHVNLADGRNDLIVQCHFLPGLFQIPAILLQSIPVLLQLSRHAEVLPGIAHITAHHSQQIEKIPEFCNPGIVHANESHQLAPIPDGERNL